MQYVHYVVPGVLAIVLLLGIGIVFLLWRKSRSAAKSMLAKADREVQRRLAQAELEAQRLESDAKIQVREKLLAARTEFERETREHRLELDSLGRRLTEQENKLREKNIEQGEREERLAEFERILGIREAQVAEAEAEVAAATEHAKEKLEQIAGLTAEQAKQELMKALENEVPLRELEFSPEEERISRGFGFLTRKPMLIVLNIGEDQLEEAEELMGEIERFTSRPGCAAIPICAKLEEEIAQLEEDEAEEFLREMGLGESALNRMIKASYELLDLITFFTGNERETRAWTARRGTTAVKAAGMIHSDMERGFIRAEVINWRDLLECGSYSKARQEGKLRIEGKDYVVQDGDVLLIRFNV